MTENTKIIKFGTDGWRGIIADDFTYANLRVVVGAIANYVIHYENVEAGICIGWDTRFGSRSFAMAVAEVLANAGIAVQIAKDVTPTPALSYAVLERQAAGGVMITSSHNPAEWNGVKYKATYGGSGTPSIMASIESYLVKPLPQAKIPAPIEEVDFAPAYIEALEKFVDLKAIKASGYKFLVDVMYGAGRGVVAGILSRSDIPCIEIRNEINPAFPQVNPEPIMPHIAAARQAVVMENCDAGLITDGDADRIGAVDEHGNVVDAHKIFSILLWWLLERKKWPGEVTRAFNTTKMIDRITARYGRTLNEHGIGFKYVVDCMLEKNILIGGEESGGVGISRHLPERDGILNSLLLANVMAEEKKTLSELVDLLQSEFGVHEYGRIDMHIAEEVKQAAIARAKIGFQTFAGMRVLRTETLDGIKLFLEKPEDIGDSMAAETWLLLRASGTEPLLRLYCESSSTESVEKLLEAAKNFVLQEAV